MRRHQTELMSVLHTAAAGVTEEADGSPRNKERQREMYNEFYHGFEQALQQGGKSNRASNLSTSQSIYHANRFQQSLHSPRRPGMPPPPPPEAVLRNMSPAKITPALRIRMTTIQYHLPGLKW